MGGVSTDGGDGLNVELNLVPFIDLLSSLVLFLLLTAVWVHISAMPTSIDAKGTTAIVSNPSNLLMIRLADKGFEISYPSALQSANLSGLIEKAGGGFDMTKMGQLTATIARMSKDAGFTPTTAVSADDTVEYGEVVHAIDVVRENGLQNVALSAN